MAHDLLQHFEKMARSLCGEHEALNEHWSLTRSARTLNFTIAASGPDGFDVGATCEAWGILPRVGQWEDCPWEPDQWSVEEMCDAYFGLVRALICADGRLRSDIMTVARRTWRSKFWVPTTGSSLTSLS
jgi:hypothetical protein